MTKTCSNCLEVQPIDNMMWVQRSKNKRGNLCKPCRSSIEARRQLEKKINLYPELYADCDHCDHIFSKKKYLNVCPKCRTKFKE